jgi:hypothetical protein
MAKDHAHGLHWWTITQSLSATIISTILLFGVLFTMKNAAFEHLALIQKQH